MEFIKGVTLFTLFVSKWSGHITAEDTDYNPDGVEVPKNLLKRGRKPIYPPKKLTIFDTLRKQAEAILLKRGVRYMKGFAIPNEFVNETINELEAVKQKFAAYQKDVVDHFDEYRQEWLTENQEFEYVIKRMITKESVLGKFEFEFCLSKLEHTEGYSIPEEKISNQILHEVAQLCKSESELLVERKQRIKPQDLVDKFQPMIEKLDCLSFGNSKILSLLAEFKAFEAAIPKDEEFIEMDHAFIANAITFLSVCSSTQRMGAIINGTFSVSEMLAKTASKESEPVFKQAVETIQQQTTANTGAFF